ncbi:hypothetical protein [Microbulbifer variabilis]|uniref:hypothetical protein n=1 Tax=Microbulbifer variabilis TaxID=266805 RepID=UPI0003806051|nr:hypothetical protein [Microbulbifer variabilis]
MTLRITHPQYGFNRQQTLSGYTLPPSGTTEEIDSLKLPSIVAGFVIENTEHEMHGAPVGSWI